MNMVTKKSIKNKKDFKVIKEKAKELAKLLFDKHKNLNQIILTGIESKKHKYGFEDTFKVSGICFNRKDYNKEVKQK